MGKRIYISADYSYDDGDRDIIDLLHSWGDDNLHIVDYVDTAEVVSGSVSDDPDCRPCDLKSEFNRQIHAASAVIFVVGDKTKSRKAGSTCKRLQEGSYCACTPYKHNAYGMSYCKVNTIYDADSNGDISPINNNSYLEHEFLQAKECDKKIIIVYNSVRKQENWLPSYMQGYKDNAEPFWIKNSLGGKIGNYRFIKNALGYE